MKNYFRLLTIYLRIGIMNEIQYRINFFVQLLQSLIALGTGLVALALVFNYTTSLGGWSRPELLVVMGVHILMGGILNTLIQPNMQRLLQDVQQGTLDYTLMKPEDAQLLVSVREFRFWQLVDVVIGFIVVGWAIIRLQAHIGLWQALAFATAILLGGLMIYCLWLIIATTSFWFIRIQDLLEMFQSLYQAGRWPVGIYPGWLRLSLTFLVPVAFAVTVPAEALTGRLTLPTLLSALGLTILLLGITRWFWQVGLANYAGASA